MLEMDMKYEQLMSSISNDLLYKTTQMIQNHEINAMDIFSIALKVDHVKKHNYQSLLEEITEL